MTKKSAKKTKPDITAEVVRVMWLDIVDDNEWQNKDKVEKAKPALCESVGFLFSRDKDTIKIIKTYSHDLSDRYGDVLTIPMGCVQKITTLTRRKK